MSNLGHIRQVKTFFGLLAFVWPQVPWERAMWLVIICVHWSQSVWHEGIQWLHRLKTCVGGFRSGVVFYFAIHSSVWDRAMHYIC